MSKAKKIVVGTISTLVVLCVVAGVVCFPRFAAKSKEVWNSGDAYDLSKTAVLQKQPGKDFKILQLTDSQLFTNGEENQAALDLMKKLTEEQKPDLVVLTGDQVSGFFNVGLVKKIIECMESTGVPWAPVYGNHDGEGKATLRWQGKQFENAKNCLYKAGPNNVDGEGNYIINIKEGDKIIESLILLDSHNKTKYEDGSTYYDYIKQNQIDWYEWAIKGVSKTQYGSYDLNSGKVVPSMAFFHIAVPEMKTAMEPYVDKDGMGEVPKDKGFGAIREGIACPRYNSGFFAKAKELGSTTDIVFGHDHANDASIIYEGIRMTYGVKTGPSPHQWNEAKAYGGTLFTIKDGTGKVEVQHIYDSFVQ